MGPKNVSEPSADTVIKSDFNSWADRKRLIIIHEIYYGERASAYYKLKAQMTEPKNRNQSKK